MHKLFSIRKKLDFPNNVIRTTFYFLGIKFSFKKRVPKGYLEENYPKNILQIAQKYSYFGGKSVGQIKNKREHFENISNLKQNLSEDALTHLNTILHRIDKIVVAGNNVHPYGNAVVYTDNQEIEALKNCSSFSEEITQMEGYYQYKHYKLPIDGFSSSVFLYKHGMDTLKTLKNIGNKTFIDVGTCMGDSILVFRDYTENKIIGFEPVQSTHALALKTMELNNIDNVLIEKLSLGEVAEELQRIVYPEHVAWSTLRELARANTEHYPETVKCETLDSYVARNDLKVGLIKVDIEGFELSFLKGAIRTIREQKPILLLSIYHSYHDFYKIKPWLEDMDLGYQFDFFKGVDGNPIDETLLICEVY